MGDFIRQTLYDVLLIEQIKYGMDLAFLDLEIIILYISYKLGKIRFFQQFIAIGYNAQTSLGT